MKTLKNLVVLGTTLGLGSVTHLAAQESTGSAPPEPPPPPQVRQLERHLEHLSAIQKSTADRLEQAMQHAQHAMELAQAQAVEVEIQADTDPEGDSDAPTPPEPPSPINNLFWAGSAPVQSLLIQSTPPNPATQTQMQEDLAVMSRLLEKAVGQGTGDRAIRVLGLELMFTPGAHSQRALALDGYGALFFLPVNVPLLAVTEGTNSTGAANAPRSPWEETRRELYSPSGPEISMDHVFAAIDGHQPAQPYDEAKVNRLKDAIIDTLKQATNLRHLKPEDYVTVVVTGPAGARGRLTLKREIQQDEDRPGDANRAITLRKTARPGGGPTSTVMTLRARKSDIDEAARNKTPLADFKSKVNVAIYTLPTATAPRTTGE